jgi:hypothetical protein
MTRNQRPDPPAGTLIISSLVVLNVIVLKLGFIKDSSVYWWLCFTAPLLIIAVIKAKPGRPANIKKSLPNKKTNHLN